MVSLCTSNFSTLARVRCASVLDTRSNRRVPFNSFTGLPLRTRCTAVCLALCLLGPVCVHTSDFSHEVFDKVLLMSLSAAFGCPVHTQRLVATDLCEGLLSLDAARCCSESGMTPCVVELSSRTDPTLMHNCSTRIS